LCQGTAKLSVELRSSFGGRVGRPTLAGNVLQLGEVADFEALTFNFALKFI